MSRFVPAVLAVLITGGAAGCESGGSRRGAEPPMTVVPLDSSLASYYRYSSGLPDSARLVVRTSAEWTTLWNRIVANHGPRPAVPDIDFSNEMLLVAAMGTRNTGGYSIEIEAVDRGSSSITASVRTRSPGKTCGTTAALTAPVAIVRIPKSTLPVQFVEENIVSDCG
jgi:hypothetical protein